jgi:DNA repair protein SbcD/Mre11
MRFLHTSDWHLGKNLDGVKNSRLDEQEKFLEEFAYIVEENNVDLVIIAGDIYDNGNPPARAEKLFYNSLKKISKDGERAVLVIAGNHDNPDRLVAANPLAFEHGVLMLGTPKSIIKKGVYGCLEVIDSGEGFIEIEVKGERVVIITMPYPSEKRLSEVFIEEGENEERKKTYSERIGELFKELSKKYREDTINLAVSHIFVNGGETSDSERSIELGGSLAVDADKLPAGAQYVALGHLHRPQRVKGTELKAYYSGSPLQYSKSEIGYSKCVYIVDVVARGEADIKEVLLSNYKPIEVWKCCGTEEAINRCRENSGREVWVYLEIETEEFISQEDMKLMNEYKKDIIEIRPNIKGQKEEGSTGEGFREKSMAELFKEFYMAQRSLEPKDEIMELFLSIASELEEQETLEEGTEEVSA